MPPLDGQETATRERIEQLWQRAEAARTSETPEASAVASSYGALGSHLTAIGRLESAAAAFENACRAEPDQFRWHYFLGVARQDDSRLEEAVDAYGRALELKPDDLPARLHRINALLELDRPEQAAGDLDLLESRVPEAKRQAAVIFARARLAALNNDHGQAVKGFERVLDLQPEASAAHYPLSQSYLRLGDREQAEQHLTRRGESRPSFDDPLAAELGRLVTLTTLEVVRSRVGRQDFDAISDLGFALANLGQVKGAAEQMEQSLQNDAGLAANPQHEARFRYLVGGLWVARAQDDRAEGHFRRAVELDPELWQGWIKLGNLEARNGRFEAALGHFSTAVKGGSADALIKRAAVLRRLGRLDEAEQDLKQALDRASRPESAAEAAAARAALLDQLGRSQEAATVLETTLKSLSEGPQLAVLHRAVGDRLRNAGDFEAAIGAYRQALERRPDDTTAGLAMAAVLGHLGRLRQAAAAYGDVLAQDPDSKDARRGQVTALLLDQRYRQAARSLRRALARDGEQKLEWQHGLARLLAGCPDAPVRNGAEAVRLAEAVFEAQPSLRHGETLAMALAENGRFERAAGVQKGLIDEVKKAGRGQLIADLQARLDLYLQRRPFHAQGVQDLIVTAPATGGGR